MRTKSPDVDVPQSRQSLQRRADHTDRDGGHLAFEDNRPVMAAQRKMADLMQDSVRTRQLHAGAAVTVQREAVAPAPNRTGLPDQLKSGVESLSGMSMDHVKVHYNSSEPAQLNAHAYAQGSDIHIAPGQEQHLPHEAWHVVQQAQGRVQPTRQMKGAAVNDNQGLEAEADAMGARAMGIGTAQAVAQRQDIAAKPLVTPAVPVNAPIQGDTLVDGEPGTFSFDSDSQSEPAGYRAWAYLDPNDPVNGSGPADSALNGSMADLKNLGYKSMIKGHLINGQLGGPGLAGNLFPITSQANSRHKLYAENQIKSEVSKRKGSGWGVYYSVEVTDANRSSGSPDASFTCEAYDWNIAKGQNQSAVVTSSPVLKPLDIESNPVVGTTGSGTVTPLTVGFDAFGNKFKYKNYEPESLSFPNAKLASGWGEMGSGKGSGSRDWSHLSSDMEA